MKSKQQCGGRFANSLPTVAPCEEREKKRKRSNVVLIFLIWFFVLASAWEAFIILIEFTGLRFVGFNTALEYVYEKILSGDMTSTIQQVHVTFT